MKLPLSRPFLLAAALLLAAAPALPAAETDGESDPKHRDASATRPALWPDGVVPYDVAKLTDAQRALALRGMQRWMDTGARIAFVPRTNDAAHVFFTGRTDAGNNTSHTGYKADAPSVINVTAFWWREHEWMAAHELGHALGFFHEHSRWDRDRHLLVRYENIKEGRAHDYDWVPRACWIATGTPYDVRSIMHYRTCWASACEKECKDGQGESPCAVLDPIQPGDDALIGQWADNQISALDGADLREAYGTGRSIYVDVTATAGGDGSLLRPFNDLAEALRQAPEKARLVLLGKTPVPAAATLQAKQLETLVW